MAKPESKQYRIIGAYDSETCNVSDGAARSAFPILHQLGIIDAPVESLTPGNVEEHTRLRMFRHAADLYAALDEIAAAPHEHVPVICCHNLSFDMYGLAPWLSGHDVRVLAKSQRRPISFTIMGETGEPALVIWDTLVFSQRSLERMGDECGYPKLSGDWDYGLVRTPETPLSSLELSYAAHDVYALLAWLGYWCRLNPDINPSDLGCRVVSKTGVVRRRRVQRFGAVRGAGQRGSVGRWWHFINAQNALSTDDELMACNASTRGGFAFCARENASRVFDLPAGGHALVYGFDATSQHPSQMVSHRYPVRFHEASPDDLTTAFDVIAAHTLDDVLDHYEKPFGVAFYGCFEFTNLRLKRHTPFGDFGIAPLAWARCVPYEADEVAMEENQQGEEFRQHMSMSGFRDKVDAPVHSFGKLEGAGRCRLWLTELAAWEVSQAYEYDSVTGLGGYMTLSFDKPSDMAVLSVMQFYAGKNAFKHARSLYYANKPIDNANDLVERYNIPAFVVRGMQEHSIDDSVVDSTYLGLKADLNSLFGIEACNEYRRDTVIGDTGIEYVGDFGVCNAPRQPKAWYQFGQRIVGWSRVAQCIVMLLSYPYVETIINGDTDSVKMVIRDENVRGLTDALHRMGASIDKAKNDVCSRVRECYPDLYDPLDGIGHYVTEFTTAKFCAAWNKAYCMSKVDPRDGLEHVRFTMAGVPMRDAEKLADRLRQEGWSFGEVCDTFLGYNVTYAHDLTHMNSRSFPEWCSIFDDGVTDYQGRTSHVMEPRALCLYPMVKTVNDTAKDENAVNMRHALRNRPSVRTRPCVITTGGPVDVERMIADD